MDRRHGEDERPQRRLRPTTRSATGSSATVNATAASGRSQIATALASVTEYVDSSAGSTARYSYRVTAYNAAGNSVSSPITAGPAGVPVRRPRPSSWRRCRRAAGQLVWRDNATNETGFVVERAANGGVRADHHGARAQQHGNVPAIADVTVKPGVTYQYGSGRSTVAPSLLGDRQRQRPGVARRPVEPDGDGGRANGNNDTVTLKWTDNVSSEAAARSSSRPTPGSRTRPRSPRGQCHSAGADRHRPNHYYRVHATNLGGASGWSNAVSVTTP